MTNSQKQNYWQFTLKMLAHTLSSILVIFIGWFSGCAPLPPLEEAQTQVVAEQPKTPMDEAQRLDNLKRCRSFGFEYWKAGEWERACRYIDSVRVYDIAHNENIYRQWTDCLIKLSYLDSAKMAYEEGIKYFPEDDYLLSSLAIMYRNQGLVEDAIAKQIDAINVVTVKMKEAEGDQLRAADFDKAQRKLMEYLPGLADMYESVEDWEMAMTTYERMLKYSPDDANTRNRLTNLIRLHRNPEEYIAALHKDIETFPNDPKRRVNLAKALLDQGHYEKAVTEYNKAIKHLYGEGVPPADADLDIYRGLALAQENLGEYAVAINTLNNVLKIKPESLPDIIRIGKNYLTLKKWTQVHQMAQVALGIDSNYGPAFLLLADLYYSAADETSGDSPKYNDKLVFTISYGLYLKAAGSADPDASSDGDRLVRSMKGSILLPTKEERFMRMKVTRPTGDDYSWINNSWSEVSYIDVYLKSLD